MLESLHHHAYGIAGLGAEKEVLRNLERLGIRTRGNPDVRLERYESLGIDEARALKEAAYGTAVGGGPPAVPGRPAQAGKKVFVVSAASLTSPAQNALLKIFEEPPPETLFFLVVPSLDILLPTLRSRLHILAHVAAEEAATERASAFLAAAPPSRLKTIPGMLRKAEEENSKVDLALFFDELENALARARTKDPRALQTFFEAKRFVRDRAPSFKLLLEHLALVLPHVK